MKYAFITQYKKTWPVDLMCGLLGVSRNAYYRFCLYQRSREPDPEHLGMLDAVKEVAEASAQCLGLSRGTTKSSVLDA